MVESVFKSSLLETDTQSSLQSESVEEEREQCFEHLCSLSEAGIISHGDLPKEFLENL